MSRVLVAGGTGYLGRFVVREFKARLHWVRVLARHPEKLKVAGPFLEPAIHDLADEVFIGEVTKPESLRGICDGIDIVFSSVGITRQKDRLSYFDVDYQGNKNLLDLALQASVRKFVFVHGFNAHLLDRLDGFQAKQKFVDDLRKSGIPHAVVCPNGFFNDMSEFLRMAQRGTVYLIGDGSHKINPIHGEDLARVCVDASTNGAEEVPVGGPVAYSYAEIAEMAFSVLEKSPRIRHVPVSVAAFVGSLLRPFNRKLSTIIKGITIITQQDFTAPQFGTHSLKEFFGEFVCHCEPHNSAN